MATVKVRFRASTVAGKAGSVYYQLTHRREAMQITTSIRITPESWDAATGRIIPGTDGRSALLQHRIDSDLTELRTIIAELGGRRGDLTLQDIALHFRTHQGTRTILSFIHLQIDRLNAGDRLGTARNYQRTLNSFSSYLRAADLPLSAVNENLIDDYNTFLIRRGVVRNTISFYMRILRSVYNKAVRQHLVEQTFPFQNVYTGVDRTRKKAVDESVVGRLSRLDLRETPPMELTRDLFLFSYCARGMAFVDMAYLRKTDIRDGMMNYIRRKTGQMLCVRLEPCMQAIIVRYAETASPYVFPVLAAADATDTYLQYRLALDAYNRRLKKLSGLLGLERGLSSYASRHSWATAARNHNVPLSVISAGMGHTSERTTQIYLALLDNSVIDAANRHIVASLNDAGSL